MIPRLEQPIPGPDSASVPPSRHAAMVLLRQWGGVMCASLELSYMWYGASSLCATLLRGRISTARYFRQARYLPVLPAYTGHGLPRTSTPYRYISALPSGAARDYTSRAYALHFPISNSHGDRERLEQLNAGRGNSSAACDLTRDTGTCRQEHVFIQQKAEGYQNRVDVPWATDTVHPLYSTGGPDGSPGPPFIFRTGYYAAPRKGGRG